jgi:DNA invertase Pin-like site-specific DNA recombinase
MITHIQDIQATYIEEVAAYVRVSSQEQKLHGLSIDAQKQKLVEYAEKHNLKIVEWYMDEGVSATRPIAKRPELQRMVYDAQRGRFKRIIFIKLDRFFRSVAEYHSCMKLIEPVIWTATEEKYDLSNANGRAFVNMKLTIAELEADTTGERIKIVNDYKVKSGMPLYGSQSMPFCYAVEPVSDGSKTKHIVKRNEEMMGDFIAHVMVNRSVRGAMLYINNKYDTSLRYNAFLNVLRNTMIYGSYKGNPNYCEPYVTKEMFDEIQQIIERNPRTSADEYPYIFTGLIKCPKCGGTLAGAPHVNSKNGKQYRYYVYRCHKHRLHKRCDFATVVFENKFEKLMLDRIEKIIKEQEIKSIEISENGKKVSKYNVKDLQTELDRLNYSWQKGRIKSVEEYDRKYDEIMAKIAEVENAVKEKPKDFSKIKETLSAGWKSIYEALDNYHKRAFWRSFVKEIQIDWGASKKDIEDIIFF